MIFVTFVIIKIFTLERNLTSANFAPDVLLAEEQRKHIKKLILVFIEIIQRERDNLHTKYKCLHFTSVNFAPKVLLAEEHMQCIKEVTMVIILTMQRNDLKKLCAYFILFTP